VRNVGEEVALALAGLGGAPGRPGHVHVVGVPADVTQTTARAAVLLASADVVVADTPPDPAVLRLAPDARVEIRPVGDPVVASDAVVVRLVRDLPVHHVRGIVDELAALDRAGIPFEVEPLPTDRHGVPTVVTAWRDRLPLRGQRVLVPRTREQASSLSMHVRSLGGEPVEAPTIAVEPGDRDALIAAIERLAAGDFTAVCLTSPNGVDAFADALDAAGRDSRVLAAVRLVACVGPGTAARLAERLHVVTDLVPDTATTAGLSAAFPAGSGRVLLPRADIATNELRAGLVAKGYDPVEVAAYRTVRPDGLPPSVLADLEAGRIDLIAFASSSTVRNFVALVGDRPWSGRVVSIGPVTTATAEELGLEVAVEAAPHTLDGLVDALCTAAARPDSRAPRDAL
jgi:uroporphyrinogen-III synthase